MWIPCFKLRLLRACGWLVASLVAIAVPQICTAGITVQILDSGTAPGGLGFFDIVLQNTGTTAEDSIFVASFNLQFSVDASSPITFINATTDTDSTLAPYIFGTLQLPPFTSDSFPNQSMTVGDTSLTDPWYTEVHAGEILGLAHIMYSLSPGAPLKGSFPVSLNLLNQGGGTELVDLGGNIISIDSGINGQINVVPEPSSMVLAGLVCGAGGCLAYRRSRQALCVVA